jgi:hypothetical protein
MMPLSASAPSNSSPFLERFKGKKPDEIEYDELKELLNDLFLQNY